MRIEYINKYAYVVDMGEDVFIFDYVDGRLPSRYLSTKKNTYFLISDVSKEHFSESVFAYKKPVIVNKDIHHAHADELFVMRCGDVLHLGESKIVAVGHPDIGMGYLVINKEHQVFHTGSIRSQVNNDKITNLKMMAAIDKFSTLMLALKKVSQIDCLITEVNPYLGASYFEDVQFLASVLKPKTLLPSNFGSNAQDVASVKKWVETETEATMLLPKNENYVVQLGGVL